MATDNKYSEVLLELKTHYQQTLAELEAQTSQIKARLTSVNTLIEDPLLGSDLLSVLQGEANSLTSTAPASDSKVADTVEPKTEAKPKKTIPKASPSKKKSSIPKKTTSQGQAKQNKQAKATNASSSILPMQWPYTQMLKIDAIAKILQENTGNSVHIDDLILQLYGELSGDELKAERKRMNNSMYKGIQQNRWIKSPEAPMCYLYKADSKATSKKAVTTKAQKSAKKTNQ